MKLKFKQIVAAQWQPKIGGLTYSLFGLTEDGAVYRFKGVVGWVPIPGEVTSSNVTPRKNEVISSTASDNDPNW